MSKQAFNEKTKLTAKIHPSWFHVAVHCCSIFVATLIVVQEIYFYGYVKLQLIAYGALRKDLLGLL